MDHVQGHPPLCNHPTGHRGVDAPGEQRDGPAVDAHRQAAGAGLGLGVDVSGVVPHFHVDGEFGMVDVHLQVVIGLMELPAHILAELDGGHGEGLVRPAGLYLKGAGGAELVVQKFLGAGQDGVLVLPAGAGQGQTHDAEHVLQGLIGPLHIAALAYGLHVGGRLPGVHPELAEGTETAVEVGLELVLEAAAVEPLEDHLTQLEQNDFVHYV